MNENKLAVFSNPDFGEVRTLEIDGEPWFVGRDVATALGYAVPQKAVRERVDEEDVLKWNTLTNGGQQKIKQNKQHGALFQCSIFVLM